MITHIARNYPTWLWHLLFVLKDAGEGIHAHYNARWVHLTSMQWHMLRSKLEYFLLTLSPTLYHVSRDTPSTMLTELARLLEDRQEIPHGVVLDVFAGVVVNELESVLDESST